MRKLVSLGLLASSFIMLSSSVLAGNVEECEFLKDKDYSKGLYGLCIAYHNTTNAKAQERILANYDKKAGPDDPVMPGTEDEVVPCTCWSADHVMEAFNQSELSIEHYSCNSGGAGLETVNFDGNVLTFFTTDTFCFFVHPEDGVMPTGHASAETELTCRAGIQEIIFELTGDECLD